MKEEMTEIELEISDEDYEYIQREAAARGITADEFIREVIIKNLSDELDNVSESQEWEDYDKDC